MTDTYPGFFGGIPVERSFRATVALVLAVRVVLALAGIGLVFFILQWSSAVKEEDAPRSQIQVSAEGESGGAAVCGRWTRIDIGRAEGVAIRDDGRTLSVVRGVRCGSGLDCLRLRSMWIIARSIETGRRREGRSTGSRRAASGLREVFRTESRDRIRMVKTPSKVPKGTCRQFSPPMMIENMRWRRLRMNSPRAVEHAAGEDHDQAESVAPHHQFEEYFRRRTALWFFHISGFMKIARMKRNETRGTRSRTGRGQRE